MHHRLFVGHAAGRHVEVKPPVEVVVEEVRAPGELRVCRHVRIRLVAVGRAVVAEEDRAGAHVCARWARVAVVGEEKVRVKVTVIVAHRKAHALLAPVRADRGADLRERPVRGPVRAAIVAEELGRVGAGRRAVVDFEDVEVAIFVIIRPGADKARVFAIRAKQVIRDVCKGTISIVVIEIILILCTINGHTIAGYRHVM